MTHRLILWDIDGTLLSTGPAGRHALERAAALVIGTDEVPRVVMSGKTDQRIIREICRAADVAEEEIDEALPQAMAVAIETLAASEEWILRDGKVHPGVGTLIDRLAEITGVRQSLVTGNLAPNARIKVGTFGLEPHLDFDVGAYGDDHHDRNELVPIALQRVNELRGETYSTDEVWIIGDTEHDLACARAAGVRCLLVGTSWDGADRLHDLDADASVQDLSDTEAILATLLS